jgi:hypothetical protein
MRAAHALGQPSVDERRVAHRSPLAASLIARVRAPQIDRQLATGVAPWRSPAHAARAVQLTSATRRNALAGSLERLLRDASRPPIRFSAVIPPCREQVLEAREAIAALVALLRSGDPIDARGAARLWVLVTDGAGPCYVRTHPRALSGALQSASQWLDIAD